MNSIKLESGKKGAKFVEFGFFLKLIVNKKYYEICRSLSKTFQNETKKKLFIA